LIFILELLVSYTSIKHPAGSMVNENPTKGKINQRIAKKGCITPQIKNHGKFRGLKKID